MMIATAQGSADHAWMDGRWIGPEAEGAFFRLKVGDNEGLLCTDIETPSPLDTARAEHLAIAAVAAAEGWNGRPAPLLTDDREEAMVERDHPRTAAEVDGRLRRMTEAQLSHYGRLTTGVVTLMMAMLSVVPLAAAWFGWDGDAVGWARYGKPMSFALVAFLGTVVALSTIKHKLDPDVSILELGEQTIAADRERERRSSPTRVVVIEPNATTRA